MLNSRDMLPFLEHLSKKREVYAPYGIRFSPFSGKPPDLNKKTRFSAKKLFLPPEETLFTFKGEKSTARIDAPRRVLFGARPCDLNAIKYMDMVFKDDPYYMKKRRNMLLIGLQCSRPEQFKNCYCHYTGTFFADNYDILLIEASGGFAAKAGTPAGRRLMKTVFFSKGGNPDSLLDALERKLDKKTKGKLKSANEIKDNVIRELARDCFSCTACTSVCPTCHSFTIEDELETDLESGKRVRKWDSCQLKRYTRVAGDVIFRPSRFQRVRQRIYCKFRYSLEDQKMMACTGCGRCIDVCNKGIDIFRVFG